MLSKALIIIALIFQIIGLIWGFIVHWQTSTLNDFFAAPQWPIFLGFVLLTVAVTQSFNSTFQKNEKPKEPPVMTPQ